MAKLHNVMAPSARGRVQPDGQGTGFGDRDGGHWGEDLRALIPNTPGDPIHAPCDATVVWVGWLTGTVAARLPYHSGLAAWLYLGRWGRDEMYMLVTHCRSVKVRAGQRVQAGQVVATLGGSGWRDGPDWDRFTDHLHLGIAQNTTKPTRMSRWAGDPGWIDPVAWFAGHGVSLNTTPTAPNLGFAGSPTISSPKEDTLSAAEVAQIVTQVNAHTTREVSRALNYIADRTSVNPGDGLSDERRSLSDVIGEMEAKLDGVPEDVWGYELNYRDQSRNTSRQMPAKEALYNISWGNAKAIDALTLKEN